MRRSATINPNINTSNTDVIGFTPQAHQWVQLRDRLSDDSDDQALLLCTGDRNQWVAWVPGYGEALLERQQLLQLAN